MEKEYKEIINDIIKYSVLGYDRFLTIADSGNVSCRYKDGILITASGVSLGEITESSIMYVDMDGKILLNPSGLKPSKETHLHSGIYQLRPDIQSIYHVHPVYATTYAVKGVKIPLLTSTAKRKLKTIPLVPYAEPGSIELSRYVNDIISKEDSSINSLMLQNHGIVTFGKTLSYCFQMAELLEATAKMSLLSHFV